jgi:hypothetical protein
VLRLLLLAVPLFLIAFGAGAVRVLAQREPPGTRRRRALTATWVLLLLAAVPLWLVAAAVLRLW